MSGEVFFALSAQKAQTSYFVTLQMRAYLHLQPLKK